MLLGRPHYPFAETRIETVNDLDVYLANFWRALQNNPEKVAIYADNPVNESDLHARHQYLHHQCRRIEQIKTDPDFFDAKIAGYWVWGVSSWIGGAFCRPNRQSGMPHLGNAGGGVNRKLPCLGSAGTGVNRQLPRLGSAGTGVNGQPPDIGSAVRGACANRRAELVAYLQALADRLRFVRVCCGDWKRAVTPAVTTGNGMTAVFLDPPYCQDHGCDTVYSHHLKGTAGEVQAWCLANGNDPLLRIALCGLDSEHHDLVKLGWSELAWKASCGYGSQRKSGPKNMNRHRERIWFSPHCLSPSAPNGAISGQTPL